MIKCIKERVELLTHLGVVLKQPTTWPEELLKQVTAVNPWFTNQTISKAISAISDHYLDESKLNNWIGDYDFTECEAKKVGLILAGNIPLVGFHDILSVFISGHISLIKLSEKDTILTKHVLSKLMELNKEVAEHFEYVERLENFDAVIATGSNSTSRYFEKYFSKVPHIIRRNRNAVAVVHKSTTEQELIALGNDMLSYYSLGCRNVSKLYIENGVELARIFEAIEEQKDIIHHHKYKNNYDYSYALYLLNKEEFFTNDFLILRPNAAITSRISVVHYEYFNSLEKLSIELRENLNKIQCVVSGKTIHNVKSLPYGESQLPSLSDFADGVDTLKFLQELN